MSEIVDTPPGPRTWQVSWTGLRTVAVLELRQRVRSTRWITILVIWALLLGAMTTLLHLAFRRLGQGGESEEVGAIIFGLIVYLVLSLGSLISPALSATSVNGDRSAGVLATLQTTLLTPAEIALGKLGAAWLTALAFLAVALPFLGWGFLDGGTPPGRFLITLTLLAVMLLVVCAVGLGWSAITSRTTSSAVLTYLTITFVGVGLPVLFFMLAPLVTTTERRTVRDMVSQSAVWDPRGQVWMSNEMNGDSPMVCRESFQETTVTHSERIWWLLAGNPFVVLADASPMPDGNGDDILSSIRTNVRDLRLGAPAVQDRCADWGRMRAENAAQQEKRQKQRQALNATWPYGLAVNLLLGTTFTAVAIRRLRAPAAKLPRGTRVA
ncbi:MAG: type transport system permease protein [Actinomycetota bacterium]|nr:type transport system permease protein [Actinomycetota bacterium]